MSDDEDYVPSIIDADGFWGDDAIRSIEYDFVWNTPEDGDSGAVTIDLKGYSEWMPDFYEVHEKSPIADYMPGIKAAGYYADWCEYSTYRTDEGDQEGPDAPPSVIIRKSFNRVYRFGCEIIRRSIVATYLTMKSLGHSRDVARLIARAAWETRNEKCWLPVVMNREHFDVQLT